MDAKIGWMCSKHPLLGCLVLMTHKITIDTSWGKINEKRIEKRAQAVKSKHDVRNDLEAIDRKPVWYIHKMVVFGL